MSETSGKVKANTPKGLIESVLADDQSDDEAGQNLYSGEYHDDEEIKDLFTFQNVKGDVTLKFFLDGSLVDEKVLALN